MLPVDHRIAPALRIIILAQLPVQHVAVRGRHLAMPGRLVAGTADADERQEHQWEFQALGLVQGQDLHAPRVRFQPQQLLFVIGIGIGNVSAQPVDQPMHAQGARVGFL